MQYNILTNDNIAASIEELDAYYTSNKIDKTVIIKNKLAVEEILLEYRDQFGENTPYSVSTYKSYGSHHVKLFIKGVPYNSLEAQDDEEDENLLLARLGLTPVWKYEKGKNVIDIKTQRHRKSAIAVMIFTLLLAVVCGLFAKLLPENLHSFLINEILAPVSDSFSSFLGALAGPVIFFTVISSVVNIGDTASLKQIGTKLIKRLFLIYAVTFIAAGIVPFMVVGISSAGISVTPYALIRDTLLSIIPDNLITPFTTSTVLQILFWGIIIAIGLLTASTNSSELSHTFITLNDVFNTILNAVSTLVPVYIFCTVFMLISNDEISLSNVGTFLAIHVTGIAGGFIFLFAITWIFKNVSPLKIVKYSGKALLTGFLTCCSLLALNMSIDDLKNEDKYGLDEKTTKFAAPMGQVLFRPFNSIHLMVSMIGIIKITGTPVSISMLITILLLCFLFGIATPSCAGGGLAIIAVLFNTLNLDVTYLPLALSFETLLDCFVTAGNVFGIIPCVLLCKGEEETTSE